MQIDTCSDLHLDAQMNIPDFKSLKKSDILLVAGDISDDASSTIDFIETMAEIYKTVIFVDGNHENHIAKSTDKVRFKLMDFALKVPSVVYLDGLFESHIVIDDVMFVGANGWYDWKTIDTIPVSIAQSTWQTYSKDSKINFGNYKTPAELGNKQIERMEASIVSGTNNNKIRSIVLMTHVVPRREFLILKGIPSWDNFTPSYSHSRLFNLLEFDVNKKVNTWIYGHTHVPRDQVVDNVRYVNNVLGYPFETDIKFKLKTLEV